MKIQSFERWSRACCTTLVLALLFACGGGGGSSTSAAATGSGSGGSSSGGGLTGCTPATGGGSGTGLVVKVAGGGGVCGALVDASGNPMQLRGVNVSALESQPIFQQTSDWNGQTGDATPNWTTIRNAWIAGGVNAVRIPLNEASWLGYTCTDQGAVNNNGGAVVQYNPNPNKDYQTVVKQSVAGATAARLYVILDLHWTAPGSFCPMAQNAMANTDNSVRFWSQVATAFKSYSNVIFEPFNEPFLDTAPIANNASPWAVLLGGGPVTAYVTGGMPYQYTTNWTVAGMQQLVNAIRGTGATNVILTSGLDYAKDLSGWLANKPTDPLNQLGAIWHAYPAFNTSPGQAAYTKPDHWPQVGDDVKAIVAAGYPVLITEFGDHITPGSSSAPFASWLLPYADSLGIGYLGWTWDVWGNPDDVLITDAAGTPTGGYGVYTKAHYVCRAAGTASCP